MAGIRRVRTFLLALFCVSQVALVMFLHKTLTPRKHAVVKTREDLGPWTSNLTSNLTQTTTERTGYPQSSNESVGYPQISNKSVHFDIVPDYTYRPFLLMLVITTPNDFLRRQVIRATWGTTHRQKKLNRSAVYQGEVFDLTKLKLVFVVGWSRDNITDGKLQDEADKYGDILRVSLNETYRNIVYKVMSAFSWASTQNPQFVLKADHDVYMNIRKLLKWLIEKPSKPSLLYTGYIHTGARVRRDKNDPHHVTKDILSLDTFPDYCAGPCYVMSKEFLLKATAHTSKVKVFEVEDAYMGIVAHRLGVAPFRNSEFVWNRSLEGSSKWSDEQLSRYICLGDSMKTNLITDLHHRYMQF